MAALAIWDALSCARDSGILKLTALTCDELKTEARKLMRDIDSERIDTATAEQTIASIYLRWEKATDKVLSAFDDRLSKQCERAAIEVMENRYAST